MTRKLLLSLVLLLGSFAQAKPNLIFIMADDLGYGDLGCFGQKLIKTPRLDQMAKEGMKFTRFYSGSTVCAPSRSVLMTGQHMGHTHVRGNAGGDMTRQSLRNKDFTVAEALKKANYYRPDRQVGTGRSRTGRSSPRPRLRLFLRLPQPGPCP